MHYKRQIVCVVVLMGFIKAYSQNPIIQTCYTADPAPMVYNDTVFLYTGHDEDGSDWFTMRDWKVFSTTDMVNWTNRGTALSLKTFSWAKSDAWAGQCIARNGKFYWYVPVIEKTTGATAIGVAVSDHPTGPFKDALGKPLIAPHFGYIDPTVFTDLDGQAYLYWGNPGLWYVKLNADMISYKGSVQNVSLTHAGFGIRRGDSVRSTQYEEGPWFFRRGSKYYMVYAAGGVPEHIAYSVSDGPTGPWRYQDTIMTVQGASFTNHPGVIDYKGKSYFFYHNGGLPGGGGFTRSVCVEPFTYNKDGSFPRLNMTTGVKKTVDPLNPYKRIEAETIAYEKGVEIGENTVVGVFVKNISGGDYIKVRSVNFSGGAKSVIGSFAAVGTEPATLEIHVDDRSGPVLATIKLKSTGGVDQWRQFKAKCKAVRGVHDLYFVFSGGSSSDLLCFDWWKFLK